MMASTELVSLEEIDRKHILRVIEHCHGNRTNAAQMLEIDRKTLYRKLGEIEATTTPEVTAVTTDKPNT